MDTITLDGALAVVVNGDDDGGALVDELVAGVCAGLRASKAVTAAYAARQVPPGDDTATLEELVGVVARTVLAPAASGAWAGGAIA